MIFNENKKDDLINILSYIDGYVSKLPIDQLQINIEEMEKVIEGMRFPFPHIGGIDDASSFKKISNFLSWFLAFKPIKTQLPKYSFSKELAECDINAVIAFDISLIALERSVIHQQDNEDFVVSNPIFLSEHSYLDILEALSEEGIKPEKHQKIFSVFLEQLVYKTNPECQYQYQSDGNDQKYSKENLKPSYQNIFKCNNCERENGKEDGSRCSGCGKLLAS